MIAMTRPFLFLLAALLATAAPLSAQHRGKKSHRNDDDSPRSRIDTTVALARNGTVDLSLISGEIVVTSWDRPQVQIKAFSEDGDLRLDLSPSRVSLGVEEDRGDEGDTRFEVIVPKDARVIAGSISGDISVRGVGELEGTSVSGELIVKGVARRATLQSVSGSITGVDLGGPVHAQNVSGDLTLTGVAGELSVQTVSGEMILQGVKSSFVHTESVSGDLEFEGTVDPSGRYEFHSHSGEMRLTIPRGAGATLTVQSFSGEISSSCQMTMLPGEMPGHKGQRVQFSIGGGGARFTIETFSGDIEIRGCGTAKTKEN
jgi:hypothetical protein